MNKTNIFIDQTLHGYSNGHRLLSSSINMSKESEMLMLRLSDLSGQNLQPGFLTYFTGYYLPGTNRIVLSCTWYADEMKRPGCVWTHSLIVNIKDLVLLSSNIDDVVALFHRPSKDDSYVYDNRISLNIPHTCEKQKNLNIDKMQYIIWAIIGNRAPVIIPHDSSKDFLPEILYIWFKCSKYLSHNFSFSTGSLSERKINGIPFELQIMPCNSITLNTANKYKILPQLNKITKFPLWIRNFSEILLGQEFDELIHFVSQFSTNLIVDNSFSLFIKLYIGCNIQKNNISITDGLQIIENMKAVGKNNLAKELTDIFINTKDKTRFEAYCSTRILIYLLLNTWLQLNATQIEYLIEFGFNNDGTENNYQVLLLCIQQINYEYASHILEVYSNLMTPQSFIDMSKLNLDVCCALIKLNCEYALRSELWETTKDFQKEILNSINEKSVSNDYVYKFISLILNTSKYDFIIDIANKFGKSCVGAFWDCLFTIPQLNYEVESHLRTYCHMYQDVSLNRLSNNPSIINDANKIISVLDIIVPYTYSVKVVNIEIWISFYECLCKSNIFKANKEKIAWFYFALILIYDFMFPTDIAKFVFNTVHGSLLNKYLPPTEWNNIEYLLPNTTFKWDRCKRVRKAFKKKGYNFKGLEKEKLDNYLL